LIYLIDLRDFLIKRREALDIIGKKVKKAVVD
jgi:hypothetical protein